MQRAKSHLALLGGQGEAEDPALRPGLGNLQVQAGAVAVVARLLQARYCRRAQLFNCPCQSLPPFVPTCDEWIVAYTNEPMRTMQNQ